MLSKQLQDQIEQESRQFAMHNYINMAVHKNIVEDDIETWPEYARVCYHSILNYMTGKEICWPFSEKSLAMQWQEAQQLVERYEKALKAISEWKLPETGRYWDREKTDPMSYEICHGIVGVKEYFMKLATEALTPKTGSDDTDSR